MSELDKRQIGQAFSRAATRYDAHAVIQREVAKRLLGRLHELNCTPDRIADFGCGPGSSTLELSRVYPAATLFCLDLSLSMARQAARKAPTHAVCADALLAPFLERSFTLVFSNLMLQWIEDLPAFFRVVQRLLQPGGVILFSTFGPRTLQELNASWRAVDDRPHVHRFADINRLGDTMLAAGLEVPVIDRDLITVTYESVAAICRDLKSIGAHNAHSQRHKGLTGKGRFRRFANAYEEWRHDGQLPVTYEVFYGIAWQRDTGNGETSPLQVCLSEPQ